MRRAVSLLSSRNQGVVFFLSLLVLIMVLVPMIELSPSGRLILSLVFTLILVSGDFTTIRHRVFIGLVVLLAVSTLALSAIAELNPRYSSPVVETSLKLVCLSILVSMTVRQTVRPGPHDGRIRRCVSRPSGRAIAGYDRSPCRAALHRHHDRVFGRHGVANQVGRSGPRGRI